MHALIHSIINKIDKEYFFLKGSLNTDKFDRSIKILSLLQTFKFHNSQYNIWPFHAEMFENYSASCYFWIFHTCVDTYMAPSHDMSSAGLVYSIMPSESKIRYYATGFTLNHSAPGGGGLEGTQEQVRICWCLAMTFFLFEAQTKNA